MPKHINPSYQRSISKAYTLQECQELITKDSQVLSHLISKAESTLEEDKIFLDTLYNLIPRKTDTKRIAITGAPGVGTVSYTHLTLPTKA